MMRMPKWMEWSLVGLCLASFLMYLLHGRAAEKYGGLYVRLLEKLTVILGR
ncbi:MAG: hypothetical protein RI101_00065 [Nitrospira sp.]|nr:hypothetical protein [Nitrospira sp.]